ncbi:MAG: hypothetical protein ABIH82_05465 [Candidatus Woesearchaeota archaeon]
MVKKKNISFSLGWRITILSLLLLLIILVLVEKNISGAATDVFDNEKKITAPHCVIQEFLTGVECQPKDSDANLDSNPDLDTD